MTCSRKATAKPTPLACPCPAHHCSPSRGHPSDEHAAFPGKDKNPAALPCVTAASVENNARSQGKEQAAYLLSFRQAPPHRGAWRGFVLCQTENPFKAEAAGTEAREGRSGPPRPAPPATAPLPQPAQRPGRAGLGRTLGVGGPGSGPRPRERPPGRPGLRGGEGGSSRKMAARRPPCGGRPGAPGPRRRLGPGGSPALRSRLPWRARAERAAAASGRSRGPLVAGSPWPQPALRPGGRAGPARVTPRYRPEPAARRGR